MPDLKDRFAEQTDGQDTRIVLLQLTGPNAGMATIGGMTSELKEHNGGTVPDMLADVPLPSSDKPLNFGLFKVTPRVTLFREMCGPKAMKKFNESQR